MWIIPIRQYDDSDLQELLSEVEELLAGGSFDDVVWGSDLNWDPSRVTYFARIMKSFMDRLGLVSAWTQHPCSYWQ